MYGVNEVVPYVGTWIEMKKLITGTSNEITSFPTWERG